MRIPAPVTNLHAAQRFARKWIDRIGETWNEAPVPWTVRQAAGRLVRWAHLHVPTKKK